jgi:deoxyribonuclease V
MVPGFSGQFGSLPIRAGVFAAVDVHYLSDGAARAALVACDDMQFSSVTGEKTVLCAGSEPYRPGEFYRRELPHLRAVCAGAGPFTVLVVDGYVDLDPAGRSGLGAHVHTEFGVPVVGVAKSLFLTATHAAAVVRGRSGRPLYVTAAGWPVPETAAMVRGMAGSFRIPDALQKVDRLARGIDSPGMLAG